MRDNTAIVEKGGKIMKAGDQLMYFWVSSKGSCPTQVAGDLAARWVNALRRIMKSRIILSILLITLAGCTNLPTSSRQPAVAPSDTPAAAPSDTPTAPPAPAQSPMPTVRPTATRILTSTPIPTPDFETLSAYFAYDVSAPLEVSWGAERKDDSQGMADVQEVSYQGTKSCQAGALLVQPRGTALFQQ